MTDEPNTVQAALQVYHWLTNGGPVPTGAVRKLANAVQEHDGELARALAMTFEVPRKVYRNSAEHASVGNIWRMGMLSADDTGTDERGDYQWFSLTDTWRERICGGKRGPQ